MYKQMKIMRLLNILNNLDGAEQFCFVWLIVFISPNIFIQNFGNCLFTISKGQHMYSITPRGRYSIIQKTTMVVLSSNIN